MKCMRCYSNNSLQGDMLCPACRALADIKEKEPSLAEIEELLRKKRDSAGLDKLASMRRYQIRDKIEAIQYLLKDIESLL